MEEFSHYDSEDNDDNSIIGAHIWSILAAYFWEWILFWKLYVHYTAQLLQKSYEMGTIFIPLALEKPEA